jgi:hypothetical protein
MARDNPNAVLGRTTGEHGFGRTTGGQGSSPLNGQRDRDGNSTLKNGCGVSGNRSVDERGENSRVAKKQKSDSKGFLSDLLGGSKVKQKKNKKRGDLGADTEPLLGDGVRKEKPKRGVSRTLTALLQPEQITTINGNRPKRSTRRLRDGYERPHGSPEKH